MNSNILLGREVLTGLHVGIQDLEIFALFEFRYVLDLTCVRATQFIAQALF